MLDTIIVGISYDGCISNESYRKLTADLDKAIKEKHGDRARIISIVPTAHVGEWSDSLALRAFLEIPD